MLNNQMVIRLMMGIGIKPVHGQLNWELALKLISNITKWRCRYRSDMVCFFLVIFASKLKMTDLILRKTNCVRLLVPFLAPCVPNLWPLEWGSDDHQILGSLIFRPACSEDHLDGTWKGLFSLFQRWMWLIFLCWSAWRGLRRCGVLNCMTCDMRGLCHGNRALKAWGDWKEIRGRK